MCIRDSSYTSYRQYCDKVAIEAQKYIGWDNDIGCEYFPADGVCLTTTDAYAVSYTHLDVYKRQILFFSNSERIHRYWLAFRISNVFAMIVFAHSLSLIHILYNL